MNITIRTETAADVRAIEAVTISAFLNAPHTTHTEQLIVSALRKAGLLAISLVADAGSTVIGHVAVSAVSISDGASGWFGLGPLSVVPEHRRRGVGSRLMHEALRILCERGAAGCVLLGEPGYYGRFGFHADPNLILSGVPPEYFQAISFGTSRAHGIVSYHDAFKLASDPPRVTRRSLLQGAALLLAQGAPASRSSMVQQRVGEAPGSNIPRNEHVEYGRDTLPTGIRSRHVDNNNGVNMHVLEAGFEVAGRPCIVCLHGFPELAYSWRHQLLPLAMSGFHVIAPDLRGYGRSVTVPVSYDDDILPYSRMNCVADVIGLVRAMGYTKVAAVIGHDWGAPTAAWCALLRPDIFQSVVLVSTPFDGPPSLPLDSANHPRKAIADIDIDKELAALPRPRKHYSTYWATRGANEDMWHAAQGVHDLLRALYYFKSADWKGNKPFPLKSWTAAELAKMPEYYIMDLDKTTAETMAAAMPSKAQVAACKWMSEMDLQVYSTEYVRTGFQGGLNLYRIQDVAGDLSGFSGRTIDVPACYIAGASEWGVYQTPGAFEAMQHGACTRLLGVHLIHGAGHSVVEEQPDQVNRLLRQFLRLAQLTI